ncbi:MAG: LuxR C-terminal-related transcriptional regulator [Chloroflexota bacterium]|jgi:LuxR family maltose regulon positive regulatory protein
MLKNLLRTKLHIPPRRPNLVPRSQLIDRLNDGLASSHKLTLLSAPAGFGKTTLLGEWIAGCQRPTAWLSLDAGDDDLTRFLTYLVAALQTVVADIGQMVMSVLQSPQMPPVETILTSLVNEITAVPDDFILVLDDYHLIEERGVNEALVFLLEHLPPQMHLVIATREDPNLPLARLRARGQLTELRVADLRFTMAEGADFLNQVMGLNLSAEDVAALENRTEGWIAGLQLAALSMRGHEDKAGFIESFTGSHYFVLDYLVEEVLEQQPEDVQDFLLRTSVLDRLCGPLCDALMPDRALSGQETLEYLAQANLFIVPLDDERRWYRYHHLFADLLRQRLPQRVALPATDAERAMADLHIRASAWFEASGLLFEAFHHAAAAGDVARAERLIQGEGMPLQFRGLVNPILHWLESLPRSAFEGRPSLWVTYASALTMTGQLIDSVEEKLQAAETALQEGQQDDKTRDLIGHMAAIRAMLAVPKNDLETIITQSQRALDYLHPDNLPVRTTTTWTLGYAYQIQGQRAAAGQAYADAVAISQASGNLMVTIAAMTCLGQVQESENQLHQAAETYRRVLALTGDPPWPAACEAYLGLARVLYQWNELDTARQYEQQSACLAAQLVNIDTPVASAVNLARLELARADVAGALATLARAEQLARQKHFLHWLPEIAALHVQALLRQGDLAAADRLAQAHELPLSQARVRLAQGDPAGALTLLEPARRQAEAKGWPDERLRVTVLQAMAYQAHGEEDEALQHLTEALALAEPGGFIRIFLNEGPPMMALLLQAARQGIAPTYVRRLQAAFGEVEEGALAAQALIEPLTDREVEVLRLLRSDLSGPEIARELMVSLNTMRTHTKNIYTKLGVNSRRAAVGRAEELGLV